MITAPNAQLISIYYDVTAGVVAAPVLGAVARGAIVEMLNVRA